MLTAAVLAAVVIAGCGSDDSNTATGAGAPDGATGSAAGGAAVEAGKQRDPEAVAEEKKNFSKEPPPVQIQSGNVSGYKVNKPTAVIVNSLKEQKALRAKVYAGDIPSSPWAATDYATRQMVGVFMPKSPKGSLIAVSDIFQNGQVIKIKTVQLLRGEGCKASGSRPNPWQVVETRKMSGTPVVQLVTQKSSPC